MNVFTNSVALNDRVSLLHLSCPKLIQGFFIFLESSCGQISSNGCPIPTVKLSPKHHVTLDKSSGHSSSLNPLELYW